MDIDLELYRREVRVSSQPLVRLSAIDISNPDNLILWVNEKIEIRISSRNLTSQMKKISDTLANIDLDPERVRYVDLRFDDIVIGPR